jgi:cyclopropane fatty-acyl-phospholipid synthase-like methyltransferase
LQLEPGQHVLEVASGSGGPALYLAKQTDCQVIGIDASREGVEAAERSAAASGQAGQVSFKMADANAPLAFAEQAFNALVCIDSMNHLSDRLNVLREWRRVLCPGGRVLFTDPVVITGPVTNDELALRSSIGLFLFVPPGVNEALIARAGFVLIRQEDVSANAALVAERWHQARERHREQLLQIEDQERFSGLQKFLAAVHSLTSERRLSRIVYLLEKPAGQAG